MKKVLERDADIELAIVGPYEARNYARNDDYQYVVTRIVGVLHTEKANRFEVLPLLFLNINQTCIFFTLPIRAVSLYENIRNIHSRMVEAKDNIQVTTWRFMHYIERISMYINEDMMPI